MRRIDVRRASHCDLEEIVSLARATVGAPGWSETIWVETLAAEGDARVVLIAEVEGRIVGFVVLGCVTDVAEMESVAVAADVRRQGIGRRLCEEGVAWSRSVGARRMELEVRATSEAARSLYASMGFVPQGMRRGYYKDPAEDAVLMGMDLAGGKV